MRKKTAKALVEEMLKSLDFEKMFVKWGTEFIMSRYPEFTEIRQPDAGPSDLYMAIDGGKGHMCSCGEPVVNLSFSLSRDCRDNQKVKFHTRRDGTQSNHFKMGDSFEGLFRIDDEDDLEVTTANCLRFNFCPRCHKVLPQVEKP
jgi:hypothetical protein